MGGSKKQNPPSFWTLIRPWCRLQSRKVHPFFWILPGLWVWYISLLCSSRNYIIYSYGNPKAVLSTLYPYYGSLKQHSLTATIVFYHTAYILIIVAQKPSYHLLSMPRGPNPGAEASSPRVRTPRPGLQVPITSRTPRLLLKGDHIGII